MQTQTPATQATTTPLSAALAASGTELPVAYFDLSPRTISELPLENIHSLLRFVDRAKSELATLTTMVQRGLELRYAEQAQAQLLDNGQDTGTTHITDAGFDVKVEIGKAVKWDEKGLALLVQQIQESGGNPAEYVQTKYSVSEAKFKAWPQNLKAPFEPLRTVTPRAPKFTLRSLDGEEA